MITLRRIAELASRGRHITRRAPEQFGRRKLIVSPDASLRWMRANPWSDESDLIDALELLAQPGLVCWDIGANVGAFGICAAHRTKAKLVMVEADGFLAACLRNSAAENPDLDIEILCCAVADTPGVGHFAIAGRGRSTNGLVSGNLSTQHGQSRAVIPVPLLTLDLMLDHFPAPDIVKIDVEGGEQMLVKGAAQLIDNIRPTFYVEIARDNRPPVLERFAKAEYEVRQREGGNWIESRDPPISEDFFAAPRERADSVFR